MMRKGEKGQAMVEFALVFPLFIILVLFIIDVSWISYQKVMFSYTSRNVAWDFFDKNLDDWVVNSNSNYILSGEDADYLVKNNFISSNAKKGNRIDPDKLIVSGSSISIFSGKKKFAYQVNHYGLDKEYPNDVNMNTSTYEIISTIYYRLDPITPISNMFFKNGIILKNKVYKVKRGTMKTVYDGY